jgi:hypothetical protein
MTSSVMLIDVLDVCIFVPLSLAASSYCLWPRSPMRELRTAEWNRLGICINEFLIPVNCARFTGGEEWCKSLHFFIFHSIDLCSSCSFCFSHRRLHRDILTLFTNEILYFSILLHWSIKNKKSCCITDGRESASDTNEMFLPFDIWWDSEFLHPGSLFSCHRFLTLCLCFNQPSMPGR